MFPFTAPYNNSANQNDISIINKNNYEVDEYGEVTMENEHFKNSNMESETDEDTDVENKADDDDNDNDDCGDNSYDDGGNDDNIDDKIKEEKKLENEILKIKNRINKLRNVEKEPKLTKHVLKQIHNKKSFKPTYTNNFRTSKLSKFKNISKSVLKIIGKSCQYSALIGISSFISYSLIGESNNWFSHILKDTIFSSTRIISDMYITMQKYDAPSIENYLKNTEEIEHKNNTSEPENYEQNPYFIFTSPFNWLTLDK